MQIVKVKHYSQQLDQALELGDLERIREVSTDCDLYLRQNLPLSSEFDEDMTQLAEQMDALLVNYRRAVGFVEQAKAAAGQQLQKLGHNRNNTHKYLEIARHLGA